MPSSSNEVAVRGKEGSKVGYGIKVDLTYEWEKDFSFQVSRPQGSVDYGKDKDGIFACLRGSVGEVEIHAGPLGAGVGGPSVSATLEAGKKGFNANFEVEYAAGKLDLGPVQLTAGVGTKGTLRADCDGVGAIVPNVGGVVVAKEGVEVSVDRFNFKIVTQKPSQE